MNAEDLVDIYCSVWSEADPQRRRLLLRQVWADGATYTDPTVHARGEDELLSHIAGVLEKRPGSRVVRASQMDVHHGLARFAWRAIGADGAELREGIDIAFISADGAKIERIIGFFGPLER